MTLILADDFNTPVGIIRLWIESNQNGLSIIEPELIATYSHRISLKKFEIQNEWLPEGYNIIASRGWRLYIEKIYDQAESLNIFCKLIDPPEGCPCGSDTGQYLDAIEIENETHHVHIGTEDGEIMQCRAEISDWIPGRFKDILSFTYSFTEQIEYGYKTVVPELNPGEGIYFHFIAASDQIRQSEEYPGERDISTWFAVDQHKGFLDRIFGDK